MTNINSFCLYFISFAPLWLAILFIDGKSIFEQTINRNTEIISIVFILVFFIICFYIVNRLIKDKRRDDCESYVIVDAVLSKSITSEYFLAYVLPLFAFDFTRWDQVIIFLIFFISLAILCVKHKYFSTNIVLEIFGYCFYECCLENNDGIKIKKMVICKKDLRKERNIVLRRINNEYMLEPDK